MRTLKKLNLQQLNTEAHIMRELDQKNILGGLGTATTTLPYCFIMSNMPMSMTPQDGNECVAATLGYISSLYGNSSQDESYFVNSWESQNPNADVYNNGMSGTYSQMDSFVGQSFSTCTLVQAGGIIGALNQGDPVFVQMSNTGTSQQHALTVIGYDSSPNNPNLALMDPATGSITHMSLSDFNSKGKNAVVITGPCTP